MGKPATTIMRFATSAAISLFEKQVRRADGISVISIGDVVFVRSW